MADGQNISDELVAKNVQRGDKNAFAFLVERYEDKIKRYSKKFVPASEIDDITQRVFLKAFVNINSFKTELKFSSWLYRIAHNELVNFLKKKKTLPLFDVDTFLPHLSQPRGDTENQLEKEILLAKFEKCFDKIKPKYKEVITLFYLEGLSYQEIADITMTPLSTVGVRITRAKQILRAICENNKKSS